MRIGDKNYSCSLSDEILAYSCALFGGDIARYSFLRIIDYPGEYSSDPFTGAPVYVETIEYVTAYTAKAGVGLEWAFCKHFAVQAEAKGHLGSTSHSSALDNKYSYSKHRLRPVCYYDFSVGLMYRF